LTRLGRSGDGWSGLASCAEIRFTFLVLVLVLLVFLYPLYVIIPIFFGVMRACSSVN
jgi:hypothetical protein